MTNAPSTPEPIRIVALVFPDVTQLDLTGPVQVLSRLPGAEIHLAWRDTEPVATDAGFRIVPTTTFADAPPSDVLFVPGGDGVDPLLTDAETLAFVRDRAAGARAVTSVCTGSLLLGAAGLLRGRRATTHWASLPLLERFGATPTASRVVHDGPVVTGAGVSSGIDFALTLAADLRGEDVAKRIQLAIEYDPQPPFDAGSPAAPEVDHAFVTASREAMLARRGPLVDRAAAALDD